LIRKGNTFVHTGSTDRVDQRESEGVKLVN